MRQLNRFRFNWDGSVIGIVTMDLEYDVGYFNIQSLFDDSLDFELTFPNEYLSSLAFSPDGTLAAIGSADGEIFIIDLETWQVLGVAQAHTGTVTQLAFSSDGFTLASGSTDGTVKLWGMP